MYIRPKTKGFVMELLSILNSEKTWWEHLLGFLINGYITLCGIALLYGIIRWMFESPWYDPDPWYLTPKKYTSFKDMRNKICEERKAKERKQERKEDRILRTPTDKEIDDYLKKIDEDYANGMRSKRYLP